MRKLYDQISDIPYTDDYYSHQENYVVPPLKQFKSHFEKGASVDDLQKESLERFQGRSKPDVGMQLRKIQEAIEDSKLPKVTKEQIDKELAEKIVLAEEARKKELVDDSKGKEADVQTISSSLTHDGKVAEFPPGTKPTDIVINENKDAGTVGLPTGEVKPSSTPADKKES